MPLPIRTTKNTVRVITTLEGLVLYLDRVYEAVKGIPHMTRDQAEIVADLFVKYGTRSVLELGFDHGVSTCYMAAALDQVSHDWQVCTIDLLNAKDNQPNVEQLLTSLGLRDRVSVFYEPTSYTWRMMKMLREDATPRFDFCYLDGAHSWFVDGFAFFLVDRLLKPGGWILFDDLDWTYEGSPALRDSERVQSMPDEEKSAEQVQAIYDLLVKTHPNYGEFSRISSWGLAQKQFQVPGEPSPVRREVIKEQVGLGAVVKQALHKVRNRS